MKDLIEKYFAGETSLEEEQQLVDYFNSGKVAYEFKQYTPLFYFIKREKQVSLSEDFDEKLLQNLAEKPGAKVVNFRSWIAPALKIAAIGIMLMGAYLFFKPTTAPVGQHAINWEKYEIKDEQLAYDETVKALRLVTSKLNKGSQKAIKEVSKTEALAKYLN